MSVSTGPKSPGRRRRSTSGGSASKRQGSHSRSRASTPGKFSQDILESLPCHFNWGIPDDINITEYKLKERIETVDGHIRENLKNTEVQSYCLLGFLKYKYNKLYPISKKHSDWAENLIKASEAIQTDENGKGLGYKAVVFANLTYCFTEQENHGEANKWNRQFRYCKDLYEHGSIQDHPEVFAMQGFSFGFFLPSKAIESIQAYERALEHEDYQDEIEWNFGLAWVKKTGLRDTDKNGEDIENKLRKVIDLDPCHGQAMIVLAKLLGSRGAFEEAEDWINKGVKVQHPTTKCSLYEQAASFYLTKPVYDWNPSSLNTAIKLYTKANECDKNSPKSLYGLGTAYMKKHFLERSKYSNKKETHTNLKNARKYLEKCNDYDFNKKHFNLASVYAEIAKTDIQKKDNLEDKADKIYNDVISNETDPERKSEACLRYAEYLKRFDHNDKAKIMLKRAIEEGPKTVSECSSLYYLERAEEMLLKYASEALNKKNRTNANLSANEEQEALKLKSWIFENRGHYQSAIFYLKKAQNLESTTDKNITLNEEKIIQLLLDASSHPQANTKLITEAYVKLQNLEGTNSKKELWLKYYQIYVEKSMGGNETLKELRDNRLQFEKCEHKIKKTHFVIPDEEENEELDRNVLDVIRETKRVLDKAMNYIKHKVYKDKPPNCYYPSPNTINYEKGNTTEEKMQNLIEKKYKFTDFKVKHPFIFKFLVDVQPSAIGDDPWLQKLIDLRNAKEHGMDEAMKKLTKDEKVELARGGSDHAAKVWKTVQYHVDKWMEHNSDGL